MKAWNHLKTVMTHKMLVMRYCFKIGLYRQGIIHDLSKFSYTEFRVGCQYWQGNRSPNNAEREALGYSASWLHHKGRNKHHFEYWIDYSLDGEFIGMKMPRRYVAEMLMDRISASRTYLKNQYTDHSPLDYYLNGKTELLIHEETKAQLEMLLQKLAKEGEQELMRYIKQEFLNEKKH
jgi:hypothetical protein